MLAALLFPRMSLRSHPPGDTHPAPHSEIESQDARLKFPQLAVELSRVLNWQSPCDEHSLAENRPAGKAKPRAKICLVRMNSEQEVWDSISRMLSSTSWGSPRFEWGFGTGWGAATRELSNSARKWGQFTDFLLRKLTGLLDKSHHAPCCLKVGQWLLSSLSSFLVMPDYRCPVLLQVQVCYAFFPAPRLHFFFFFFKVY